MYFLCLVGVLEFQEVQQVSMSPGHDPSGASHSTFRPENMHENMFRQVPAHPDRLRKFRFFRRRLRFRLFRSSWYRVRYRRRCGLSVTFINFDHSEVFGKNKSIQNSKVEVIQTFEKYEKFEESLKKYGKSEKIR